MHEEIRKGSQGLVNPGASLVPHPVQLQALHMEPGGKFVGAPATNHDGIILHISDREDDKPVSSSSISSEEGESKTMPENVKDDRYQTHFVEINKDNEGHSLKHPSVAHSGLRVGEAIHGGDYAHEGGNGLINNDAEAEKVVSENKHHREGMKENIHENPHDEHEVNEMHKPLNHDLSYLALPQHKHEREALQTGNPEVQNSVVDEQASERSILAPKPAFSQTETGIARSILPAKLSPQQPIQNGNKSSAATLNTTKNGTDLDDIKGNMKAIGDMLKMFDKATKTLSSKIIKNSNKIMIKEGKTPFIPQAAKVEPNNARTKGVEEPPAPAPPTKKEGPNLIPEAHPESANVAVVKQMVQNLYNLTSRITNTIAKNAQTLAGVKKDELAYHQDLYKNFTDHQKGAYKAWRRQALINFHERNPNKPIPRNTVSLSENSLCPKFCRLFCDPWCVKIGCCKLSQEKLNAYKEIERKQSEAQLMSEGKNANDKRNLHESGKRIKVDYML